MKAKSKRKKSKPGTYPTEEEQINKLAAAIKAVYNADFQYRAHLNGVIRMGIKPAKVFKGLVSAGVLESDARNLVIQNLGSGGLDESN